jgi:hypothetical protein
MATVMALLAGSQHKVLTASVKLAYNQTMPETVY